jgi:hypothetical protein
MISCAAEGNRNRRLPVTNSEIDLNSLRDFTSFPNPFFVASML